MNELGPQQGAIRSLHHFVPFFLQYEWVVRLNPDVQVLRPLLLQMEMRRREVVAVLANCDPDVECRPQRCTNALVNTDFQAFRPGNVEWKARNGSEQTAEEDATRLFRSAIVRWNVSWIQSKGFKDRSCRVRAGVREGGPTVVHPKTHQITC